MPAVRRVEGTEEYKEDFKMDNRINNNRASVVGEVAAEFEFSHELYGEKFYTTELLAERTSGVQDRIVVMVSDKLIDVKEVWKGLILSVSGRFQSHNRHMPDGRNKMELFVFVTSVEVLSGTERLPEEEKNNLYLDGYICKTPVYRVTPLGREIADVLLAVNRAYGRTDYIPCVCWGRNAKFASRLNVGAHCVINGRIQSKTYWKVLEDGRVEDRVAREISVRSIELQMEEEQ